MEDSPEDDVENEVDDIDIVLSISDIEVDTLQALSFKVLMMSIMLEK